MSKIKMLNDYWCQVNGKTVLDLREIIFFTKKEEKVNLEIYYEIELSAKNKANLLLVYKDEESRNNDFDKLTNILINLSIQCPIINEFQNFKNDIADMLTFLPGNNVYKKCETEFNTLK